MTTINPKPPKELLRWAVTWKGEPRPRQAWVSIQVWVPAAVASHDYRVNPWKKLTALGDYLEKGLGWPMARTVGWSGGASIMDNPDDLVLVDVPMLLPREVRQELMKANS